jgi:hypothetical protein
MKNIISLIFILALILALPLRATPASGTATQGQAVTISVTVDGTPPFTYSLTKNGVVIAGATGPSYLIASVGVADAGTYVFTVSNPAGSAVSDNAVLTVNPLAAPTFTTQPANMTANLGKPATFTVVASGTPAPTLQWLKNGVAIQGATGATYSIAAVAKTDTGTYSCQATNSSGTATSQGAVLVVIAPPVITGPTITITMGTAGTGNATLAVGMLAQASPASYQWQRNGKNIPGATGPTYTLTNATLNIGNSFAVLVGTSSGQVKSPLVTIQRNR